MQSKLRHPRHQHPRGRITSISGGCPCADRTQAEPGQRCDFESISPVAPNCSKHGNAAPGVLPRHRERMLEEHLEGGTDPWRLGWKYEEFHVFQPLRTLGPTVLERH